jgi:glucosyl-3-phosphoglycerate synthase
MCRALASASWIAQVVIPMNGVPAQDLDLVRAFFQKHLPFPLTFLPTDHPSLESILAKACDLPPRHMPHGKGLNVWSAFGFLHAQRTPGLFALQDCDVLSFQRSTLARLCFAASEPSLDFDFAKMYYSRVSDRLYGRVSRLFLAPLLHALIRVAGHHPLLDFLQSFRYPLAGECALQAALASKLPLQHGWSLEIGMLCALFRQTEPHRMCQVDGGTGYDHKHQPAASSLSPMCSQIARTLLEQLALEGCAITPVLLESLADAHRRESLEAVRRSVALASINGIPCDRAAEESLALAFADTLPKVPPHQSRPLPPWESIERATPALLDALLHWQLPTS